MYTLDIENINNNGGESMQLVIAGVILLVQVLAPKYLSIIIMILKMVVPDSIPYIDEAISIGIAIAKIKQE